ncbi:MAG: alpha/beta fold hydrolase [Acidiferrobacterales bacterium]
MRNDFDEASTLHRPDGVVIAYRRWSAGTGSAGLIVLIHGMASNMTRWSEFVRDTALRNTWDITRLDLRGHAGSLVRAPIGMPQWCDDIAAILDAERHPHAVLIGHCLGANIALQFAARYPEKTRGLVLIEPMLPAALSGTLRTVRALRPCVAALAAILHSANRIGIYRRHIPPLDLENLDRATRLAMAAEHGTHSLTRRYASPWQDLKIMPSANYLEDLLAVSGPLPPLTEVHAPSLALLSTGGVWSSVGRTRESLAKLRQCRVLTLDSRHWIPTEAPDAMRQAIEHWCAGLVMG